MIDYEKAKTFLKFLLRQAILMKTKSSAFDFDFDWQLWVCQLKSANPMSNGKVNSILHKLDLFLFKGASKAKIW